MPAFGTVLVTGITNVTIMVIDNSHTPNEKQGETWENPGNPEQPSDSRDDEQLKRQHEEAERRKNNLTETDHIDKEKKTE